MQRYTFFPIVQYEPALARHADNQLLQTLVRVETTNHAGLGIEQKIGSFDDEWHIDILFKRDEIASLISMGRQINPLYLHRGALPVCSSPQKFRRLQLNQINAVVINNIVLRIVMSSHFLALLRKENYLTPWYSSIPMASRYQ